MYEYSNEHYDPLITELVNLLRKVAGLEEITFVLSFDRNSEDKYDASMDDVDYTHMVGKISFRENLSVLLFDDPEAFTRLLLHEMLHYHTAAGTYTLEEKKKSVEFWLGLSAYVDIYNSCLVFEEMSTVRLERALLPVALASEEWEAWEKKLTNKRRKLCFPKA